MKGKFTLKILRGESKKQYFEEFELDRKPLYNMISALMDIQKNPYTKTGEKVEPIVWEMGCLEEVCGSCSMLINGRPRQACTAIIEDILNETNSDTITLAPLSKFSLVRDLFVNREVMFDHLKKVRAWIDTEGSATNGFGPKISQEKQMKMYTLSTCMTCGCCSEACPQVNPKTQFMGPAPISQVRLFNDHPTGQMQKRDRLHALMQEGGIEGCGNSQNCVQVCPKHIPLTESIAVAGRDTTKQLFSDIFSIEDRSE
ncbi:MAG: succinate dehydrogenase iron-sulfur subunit [Simkaniaceae bacterium]|nr:succinate dehydrogenase iron-sulfur subunit [Simkaniaceae bacterium]MCF7851788.1 succinate dehydrogenase iron-sulfur subunit [Simkaniaceae bacterium]